MTSVKGYRVAIFFFAEFLFGIIMLYMYNKCTINAFIILLILGYLICVHI